jgi:hypothetical protein
MPTTYILIPARDARSIAQAQLDKEEAGWTSKIADAISKACTDGKFSCKVTGIVPDSVVTALRKEGYECRNVMDRNESELAISWHAGSNYETGDYYPYGH